MKDASAWSRNARAMDEARRQDREDHERRVRRRIKALVDENLCNPAAVAWFGSQSAGDRAHASFKSGDERIRNYPALRLGDLRHLQAGAILSVSFVYERRSLIVLKYSIGLRGKSRQAGLPWYARIDLDEEQKGQGPCGHPNLHCHVGGDPEGDAPPDARVPLPWLAPDEALTWLLATVDPRFEPRES
jgi:hypothetical protein